MRLLQLNPNGSEASALDLHPMLTVVTGLGPTGRDVVLKAIEALPTADDPGCAGLVEAHGVLLDLGVDALRLLGLDGPKVVVIRPADLPDHAPGTAAPATATGPRRSADEVIAQTPVGLHPDLDAARQAHANANEALAVLREAAGARFDDLELSCLLFFVTATDDRFAFATNIAPAFGITPEDALEVPLALTGSVDEMCEQLEARRERWGISYVVCQGGAADTLAPVVARLAGT